MILMRIYKKSIIAPMGGSGLGNDSLEMFTKTGIDNDSDSWIPVIQRVFQIDFVRN